MLNRSAPSALLLGRTVRGADRWGNNQGYQKHPRSGVFVYECSDAEALLKANKRGIDVTVVLDKSQKTEKYSSADFLHSVGIPVWIDAKHAIAHNKIMVIDGATVITGSFNFTKSAQERNAENVVVIDDKKIAGRYLENWNAHQAHAVPYEGK